MAPFRRHDLRWAACLPLFFILSACSPAPSANPAPVQPPRRALWTNTFPPINNSGAALRFLHYGLDEGLSQSTVQTIMQDDLGFLWVGTQDGLNRFDGYSFKVFRSNPEDPYALSGSEILSMIQGSDGTLWIGTNSGLNRYDPVTGRFTHWLHDDQDPDSLINDSVRALYQDSQGILWVGTRQGLDSLDPAAGKFSQLKVPDKASGSAGLINALYQDRHGTLWIGTNDGLISYALGGDKTFKRYRNESANDQSLSFNEVSCIVEYQDGMLWVGTHQGLNLFDSSKGEFTRFAHDDSDPGTLSDDYVQVAYIDRANEVWVGTRSGLDRLQPSDGRFIHYRNDPADLTSLSNNTVDSIYEDRGGLLWVGTNDGGLNEHDRSQDRFAWYHHINGDPNSLAGDIIFPILASPNGNIWVGTYQAGLDYFDPVTGRAEHFRHDPANSDSLLNDVVVTLFMDSDKTLWVGTHQGLDKHYPGSSKFFHYVYAADDPQSIPFGTVYAVYQDNQSNYWVGTAQGLRSFDPLAGKFAELKASGADPAGLADGPVRAIYQDQAGMLWFGTDTHGLFRFNPTTKELEQFKNDPAVKNSLSSNAVMDIYQDSRGMLWIATFGGGLDRYLPDENGFAQFRRGQGLPNDVVYGILEDADGYLWLSTNLGISRLDVSTGTFENYTVKDGLQSNEFNSSAFAKDRTGRLYFGGIKGMTSFDPADIQKNTYVPPLVLTALTTQDGHPLAASQTAEAIPEVTLTYPENSFDLSFAALSFSQETKNQYKYMLEGFEQTWHIAGSDHQGSYTNLPGGTYTLRVLGSNSDRVWNEAGTSVKVTVIPPFWQTWIFRGFTGIALIAAAVLAYRSRMHGIQAQKSELEHVIFERTQTLQKQNLDLEALYSADEKMLRVLTQDEVLQALVDVAVDILEADKSAVFTPVAGHKEFSVRVSRGFRSETVQSPGFSRNQKEILLKAAAGKTLVINDTLADPWWEWERGDIVNRMSGENIRSLMYIPIKVQNSFLGVLNICSSQPGAFDEDRQRLFASLVQRAALSIENSRLFETTKHIAILEERNRLAQELHDSAKQKAFAALAHLGTAKKLAHQDHGSAPEHLEEAENLVSEVIRDLTFFIQEFYPNSLKEKGLAASLREYAPTWESRAGIPLNLSITGERRLPLPMEQTLYRILQEGLSNIARHSQATQANVALVYRDGEVRMQIGDNGKGFNLERTDDGLGLRLIHQRLEGMGGEVDIQSGNSDGTLLTIRVPTPL
jgi:ligand-binding sensor domain-containing protein/signal transduction histidine kinase